MQEIVNWIITQLNENQVFSGLVGGSIFASGLYALRAVPNHLLTLFKRRFVSSIFVSSDNAIHEDFLEWISHKAFYKKIKRVRIVKRRGSNSHELSNTLSEFEKIYIFPQEGTYLFFDKMRPFIINIQREKMENSGYLWSFNLSTLSWGGKYIKDLAAQFELTLQEKDNDKIEIYKNSDCFFYEPTVRSPKGEKSITLSGDNMSTILSRIDRFLVNKDFYVEHGINHKLCFLFHGKAGTGKTSMSQYLASKYKRKIYSVSLESIEKPSDLSQTFQNVHRNSILLLEDFDAQKLNLDRDKESDFRLSLSSILNELDGLTSPEDCIIIITANHIEKFDEALIRKGRVDCMIEFEYFNADEAIEHIKKFRSCNKEMAQKTLKEFYPDRIGDERDIVPADLQDKLIYEYV